MMRSFLPSVLLLLAACSGRASEEDRLREAANQSTPEAAEVLNGAAENGMDANAAVNAAAEAQTGNGSGAQPDQPAVNAQ